MREVIYIELVVKLDIDLSFFWFFILKEDLYVIFCIFFI